MKHPRCATRCAMFRFPPQGGIAGDRGDPGHGDRWGGLLRGLSALSFPALQVTRSAVEQLK